MDYTVPFLSNDEIMKKADLFRKEFWGDSIPVDIERIIELKLEFNIIPSPDLEKNCDVDALIASNWKDIYVDNDRYLDDRYQNRLRFSLAHEIGHFVLHKYIWESFNICNFEDFYRLIKDIPLEAYSRLELQARKFAGYLLVPIEELIIEREKAIKKIGKSIDKETLNPFLAIPISKVFAVSEQVVEIALNNLD